MDVPDNPASKIRIANLQQPVVEIINKLQQADLFRAMVIATNGKNVLLDTAFGQLEGLSTDSLRKGDEIFARLLPAKSQQTIQVEQILNTQQALPAKVVNQLIKLIETASKSMDGDPAVRSSSSTSTPETIKLPLTIKVIGHHQKQTIVQLQHKNYAIPRQTLLEKGETLLLKTGSQNKVEAFRITPETVLKNALSQLLPRVNSSADSVDFSRTQKLINRILQFDPSKNAGSGSSASVSPEKNKTVEPVINREPTSKLSNNQPAVETLVVKPKLENSTTATHQKELPVKLIKQLLQQLSQPLIKAENVSAESVQKIFRLLSLLQPSTASTQSTQNQSSLVDRLNNLHTAVSRSPNNFKLLLQQLFESNAAKNKTQISDNFQLDNISSFKTELLQQLEQTISQYQLQKTTLRLNQEHNQPVTININIPLQIKDQTTSLKLKIKQRNSDVNHDEKHWEIHLAFKFASLGLISTNILLQDSRLSAHFWAEKPASKVLIDTHMHQFKDQLKKSGFELGLFDCFVGKPAFSESPAQRLGDNLVDLKA